MGALSPTHWAIIVVVVLLLFGSRKLPDLARGVGQSLRIFKAETSELRDGEKGTQDEKGTGEKPAVEKGGASAEISTSDTGGHPTPTTSSTSSTSGATPSAPGASAGSGTPSSAEAASDERIGGSR